MRMTYLMIALIALASCSVKEDRLGCPTYIHPMCTDIPVEGDLLVTVKKDGRMVYQQRVSREVFDDPGYLIKAPRGYLEIGVTAGLKMMRLKSGDEISTDRVSEADRIYSFCSGYELTGEKEDVVGTLEKQHSLLFIEVLGDSHDSHITVSGLWSGMNVCSMAAVRGDFSVDVSKEMKDGDEYVLCMTRQGDYSMKMKISRADSDPVEVNIGKMLKDAGYILDNPVLTDVHVRVDFSHSMVFVRVGEWGEVVEFNVVMI